MSDLGHPTPVLNVANVPASVTYYIEKLGFKQDWVWGDPPSFASVSRGETHIFLCEGAQGHAGTWMWIPVHDVDALHEEFTAREAIIRQPPTNLLWGSREMNVADPDGHRIRFAGHATGEADGTPLVED